MGWRRVPECCGRRNKRRLHSNGMRKEYGSGERFLRGIKVVWMMFGGMVTLVCKSRDFQMERREG